MKDITQKTCSRCKMSKHVGEFGMRGRQLQPYCKNCNREYNRAHYQKHKAQYKKDCLERRWQLRLNAYLFVKEYAKNGCECCDEKDFEVLEFDHKDPTSKKYTISKMVSSGYSTSTIKKELEKCQILCANCHKRKTAKQQSWYRTLHEYANG